MTRLLMTAYACDPNQGSESGAGWALLSAASELCESITVVTRSGEAPALESECEQLGCEVRVVRIATLPAEEAGSYGRYLRWLWHTSLFVRREAANFDVLHHATFASDWLPPPVLFGGAGGVRLVWGPAGGNTYPPMRLAKRIGMRYLASTVVRTCSTKAVRSLTHIFMSGRVDTFIAMNSDSGRGAPRARNVVVQPNCVLGYDGIEKQAVPRPKRRLLFVGRLLQYKGIDLILDALEQLGTEWSMTFVGEGPARGRIEKSLPYRRGQITLRGWRDRSEVVGEMGASSALLFPSMHDSGGWVAAEAAAVGLPVVCLDLGGVPTLAGRNAVTIPVAPASTLASRIARSIVETELSLSEPQRDWTRSRLTSVLSRSYGQCNERRQTNSEKW
ncbi:MULTISPECIES: glycosyltransferase family 4 protein [Rhodococcus]|uniref:glycosyltransferase family 4 protein n=1 Tax=Rhodococcus TaxID=1827 RepID=UPI0002B7BFFB|nr:MULTISPECIES: glycosyltransferase family 4 protein [Rhodococcus]EME25327.1 glycosyltransferase [Rhodococcus qingshengii BKS 20-40]MCT6736003.1 glycosyltransferase family 4 protein [Rhodococcus qingshengii]MDJ0488457.1 glycosyltransferase family 4 protein [Rhodococcus qingshengii]